MSNLEAQQTHATKVGLWIIALKADRLPRVRFVAGILVSRPELAPKITDQFGMLKHRPLDLLLHPTVQLEDVGFLFRH
jgi:hypothetical protein